MEIEGHPNYLIYPDGRVWSKKTNKYLKPRKVGKRNKQYYAVTSCKGVIKKNLRIHRLVATHYIPNPDNKPCVDHINRDKLDNRLENLRWATVSENCQNTKMMITNKLGYKNISYCKGRKNYQYQKMINGIKCQKYFKTLKEALCYKYIFTLKIRAGLV